MATIPTRLDAGAGSVSARLHDERFAAAYTGLSLSTIRRMRRKRLDGAQGPQAGPAFVYVVSKSVRYDQRDLDAWIESLPRAGGGGLP